MRKIIVFIFLTSNVLVYNQCTQQQGFHSISSSDASSPARQPSSETNEDNNINQLKTPKPETLCGQSGYEYLMTEYLYENCVGCHAKDGFAEPPMADRDVELSYQSALPIEKNKFLKSVSENSLCGDCNLDPNGEVYKAIEEWIDNRSQSCD